MLLPLYTATLTQREFGAYVAVRTNIEVLTYLLHFGLISAVARLYFDYRKQGQGQAYIGSIALWFPVQLLLVCGLLVVAGEGLWRALSPNVAVMPYLAFAVAIAAANFYFNLATTMLRAEQKVKTFVAVQLGVAAVLVGAVYFLLVDRRLGLPGLMTALFASAIVGALATPLVLRGGIRLRIDFEHVRHSLRYAAPIVSGLLAYFILNRISVVILQQYVPVTALALYGLAQQIALIVAVAGAAFGKAIQPILFATAIESLPVLMRQTMAIYVIALSAVATLILLFGVEIVALIAPATYRAANPVVLILVPATFAYALTLASDTAVLCFRKPGASAAITAGGAALSATLSMILIPRAGLLGGAAALLIASAVLVLIADRVARRLTGFSNLGPAFTGIAVVGGTAIAAHCIQGLGMSGPPSFAIRSLLAVFLTAGHLILLRRYLRDFNDRHISPS